MEKPLVLRTSLALILPLAIFAAAFLLATSSLAQNSSVSLGITLDFVLTAPLLYFLVSRKTKLPPTLVFPLIIVGTFIAAAILPQDHRGLAEGIKQFVLPLIELGALSFIGYKFYQLRKAYKGRASSDSFLLLQSASRSTFGKAGNLLATELGMLYFSFIAWKPQKHLISFSVHKESGRIALYAAIMLLIAVETIALHFILALWSHLAAWIATIASIYTLFQFFAHIKALYIRRAHLIDSSELFVPNGLFGGVKLPLAAIEKIEPISGNDKFENIEHEQLALLAPLEIPNLAIYLNREIEVEKPYGQTKTTKLVLISIDERERFVEYLLKDKALAPTKAEI